MLTLLVVAALWLLLGFCGLCACVVAGRADDDADRLVDSPVAEPEIHRIAS